MKAMSFIHNSALVFIVLSGVAVQSLQANESKNIVVYGASGRIGQVIVEEALQRGYKVKGVSRNPDKLNIKHNNFTATGGDLTDLESTLALAKWADAIVIAITAKSPDKTPEKSLLVTATRNVLAVFDQLEKKPYIVQIGGANLMYGSTYAEVKKNMHDAPFNFDKGTDMYAVLFGHQISLEMYKASNLSWTVLAPPMMVLGIYRGKDYDIDRTTTRASYRLSTSEVPVDEEGKNTVYVRDLAKATLNEIENRDFNRQVFTVGY
jgi:uncharacterized protein